MVTLTGNRYAAATGRPITPPSRVTLSPPLTLLPARLTDSVRASGHEHWLPVPNRARLAASNTPAPEHGTAPPGHGLTPPQSVSTLNSTATAGEVSEREQDNTSGGAAGEGVAVGLGVKEGEAVREAGG